MKTPAPADLRRWSEDVARDPGSLSFLPLAEFYRRQGQREAALRLCIRGLERNPESVGGHGLLARLYLEMGEREKAYDEWGFVLRLDDGNFEAHRGLGFYQLERGDLAAALGHLEHAATTRPDDPLTREALTLVRQRLPAGPGTTPAEPEVPTGGPAPGRAAPPGPEAAGATAAGGHGGAAPAPAVAQAERPATPLSRDPSRLFGGLEAETPFRGALLLDAQGLVLAGGFTEGGADRSEALGAILGGAIEEADRTTELLRLGGWNGILLHARDAVLHIAPADAEHVVVLAATREAPTGWVLRSAQRALELAQRFLEATRG